MRCLVWVCLLWLAGCASGGAIRRSEALAQLNTSGSPERRIGHLVEWLHARMPWVPTDYRERTAEEILERGAGNCAEHARVLQSLLEERGFRTRWVREINFQAPSASRQASAERLVASRGRGASVFGLQHNDHRWLEVWEPAGETWFPVDSALGIWGLSDWTRARVGFSPRPPPAKEMLVPFVVAAEAGDTLEDRSRLYLVDAFDQAYGGKLSALPSWVAWREQVKAMAPLGLGAFRGEVNLHAHAEEMARLLETYRALAREAQALSP